MYALKEPIYTNFLGADGKFPVGEVIMSEPRLKRLVNKLKKVQEFAYDTETNTLRVQHEGDMDLVGISICFGENDTYYIPTGHYFDEGQLPVKTVVKYLKPVFERTDVRIIGWNLKFDLHVLANVGIHIKTKDIFDGMIARWITNENVAKSLKESTSMIYGIAQTHFDECLATVTNEEKKQIGLKANSKALFWMVRLETGAPYALADAYWTWRHYVDWQMDEIADEKMETIFYKVQMPFLKTLYNMERRGVHADLDKLKAMQVKAEKDLADLEYKIVEIAGVKLNIGSSQQVAELLFGYKKFNKKGEFSGNVEILEHSFDYPIQSKTPTGIPKTGESELVQLTRLTYKRDERKQEGKKMIKYILMHKRLSKLKSAFIDGLLAQAYDDSRIHPSFNQVGTDSGRLSCSNPNLQQLPRPVEVKDFMTFEKWAEEQGLKLKEIAIKKANKDLKNLEYKDNYPTGEIDIESTSGKVLEYCDYLKSWRDKNEENIFWKFYEIRACFIPDNPDTDAIIALDYSNLEMRLLAHFSQDPVLMETFVHEHDAHGATAVNMFALDCEPDKAKKKYPALRQIAKTINFLLMYGGSAMTLYGTLKDEEATDENGDPVSKEKAQEYYDKYFDAYQGVANFIKNQKKFAHRNECVYSLIGRKRRLPEINSADFRMSAYQERLSVNSCIQGSGGDIMMMCQPKIDGNKRLLEMGCTMRLQVHDELVFNCPKEHVEEAIKIIKDLMEHPLPKPLNIPLRADADFGSSYAEAK
jgi:DNA polymerase I-like protein with 3'-5' exonuclease and polymerase domains